MIDVRFKDGSTGKPLTRVNSLAHGVDGTRTVGFRVSGAPRTAERDRQLWRSERTHLRLARTSPDDPDDKPLKVVLKCSRLGYQRRTVDLTIEPGRTDPVDVTLEPLPDIEWVTIRPEARYGSGTLFNGALSLGFSGSDESMTVVMEFVNGKAKRTVTVPAGAYTVEPKGAPEGGRFWLEAGRRLTWEARSDAPALHLVLRGNPMSVVVRDPEGRAVSVYEVGIVLDGGGMVTWQSRWVLDTDGVSHLMLPPGSLRVLVRAFGGAWEGEARIEASGDGDVLNAQVRLHAR